MPNTQLFHAARPAYMASFLNAPINASCTASSAKLVSGKRELANLSICQRSFLSDSGSACNGRARATSVCFVMRIPLLEISVQSTLFKLLSKASLRKNIFSATNSGRWVRLTSSGVQRTSDHKDRIDVGPSLAVPTNNGFLRAAWCELNGALPVVARGERS